MRSPSPLEITTLPSVEMSPVIGSMPDMPQPYRRVIQAGDAQVKYSGYGRPAPELITLPDPLQQRIASFITRYMTGYEPRVDSTPFGDQRYMCHTFAQYLLSGSRPTGRRVLDWTLQLAEGGMTRDDDYDFNPGALGMIADPVSGIPVHSFVSLGGPDTLQVMEMNSHIGLTTTDQLLDYYRDTMGAKEVALRFISPLVIAQVLPATRELQAAHHL